MKNYRHGPLANEAACADFLCALRRGTGEVLFLGEDAALLRETASGIVLFAADSAQGARGALEVLPDAPLYVAHGEICKALLCEKTHRAPGMACTQAVYRKKQPPAMPGHVEVRVLDESYAQVVHENYHSMDDRAYIERRVKSGAMLGAFCAGELAGFIGTHEEGSIGLLEVFAAFRRHGVGYALECAAIRRELEAGGLPYCQVVLGNEASLRLQQKLGFEFAKEPLYWFF